MFLVQKMEKIILATQNDAFICHMKKYAVFLRESVEFPVQVTGVTAGSVSHTFGSVC